MSNEERIVQEVLSFIATFDGDAIAAAEAVRETPAPTEELAAGRLLLYKCLKKYIRHVTRRLKEEGETPCS